MNHSHAAAAAPVELTEEEISLVAGGNPGVFVHFASHSGLENLVGGGGASFNKGHANDSQGSAFYYNVC
jgi:hypothetical protein